MSKGIILKCDCAHEFQDKKYGQGYRVHNLGFSKTTKRARCTVCGKQRQL